jgi:rhodanese-related sulfurtransferase
MKLIYDNASGRVLGAQIVGKQGVDKRIDVIATAIHFGATVESLASVDLAYAPQFGSAKDPVHLAAMIAQNQRLGLMKAVAPAAIDHEILLDVRTAVEHAQGTLVNAINIPLDELRGRLGELNPSRPTVVFCQIGMRGYIAQRILTQHGFQDVRNLKGGYALASQLKSGMN